MPLMDRIFPLWKWKCLINPIWIDSCPWDKNMFLKLEKLSKIFSSKRVNYFLKIAIKFKMSKCICLATLVIILTFIHPIIMPIMLAAWLEVSFNKLGPANAI